MQHGATVRIELELSATAVENLELQAATDAKTAEDGDRGRSPQEAWEAGRGAHQGRLRRKIAELCDVLGGKSPIGIVTAVGGAGGGLGWMRVHLHGAVSRILTKKPARMELGTGEQIRAIAEDYGVRLSLLGLTAPCPRCHAPGGAHYCERCDIGRIRPAPAPEQDLRLSWRRELTGLPQTAYRSGPELDPVELLGLSEVLDAADVEEALADLERRIRGMLVVQREIAEGELVRGERRARNEGRAEILAIIDEELAGAEWTAENVRPRLAAMVAGVKTTMAGGGGGDLTRGLMIRAADGEAHHYDAATEGWALDELVEHGHAKRLHEGFYRLTDLDDAFDRACDQPMESS